MKRARRLYEQTVQSALFACAALSILVTFSIVAILFIEAAPFFREVPLSGFLFDPQWTPLFLDKHFGIGPLICGTVLTTLIAMLVALPLGVLIAVYLSEFAAEGVRRTVKPVLEILAGIPTIVYGYFALLFVTPLLQRALPELSGFNALSAGLVMGMMILPLVASLSEDALYAVPVPLKDAAYALGSSRLQMTLFVLLPAALGGISAAFVLAVSRAVGETMIVAIAAGQQPQLTLNPLAAVETMTAYVVQISLGDTPQGTLEYRTIFAVALVLFLLTLVLNLFSLAMRRRYMRRIA